MRVFVYRNLTRKCWSVKALDGPKKGRVIAHPVEIVLADATFKVSEAGRQRVLRQRQRNVHAGIVGTLCDAPDSLTPAEEVCYNPYRAPTFTSRDGTPLVASVPYVYFSADGRAYLTV
jgi:hypothetical protein